MDIILFLFQGLDKMIMIICNMAAEPADVAVDIDGIPIETVANAMV